MSTNGKERWMSLSAKNSECELFVPMMHPNVASRPRENATLNTLTSQAAGARLHHNNGTACDLKVKKIQLKYNEISNIVYANITLLTNYPKNCNWFQYIISCLSSYHPHINKIKIYFFSHTVSYAMVIFVHSWTLPNC